MLNAEIWLLITGCSHEAHVVKKEAVEEAHVYVHYTIKIAQHTRRIWPHQWMLMKALYVKFLTTSKKIMEKYFPIFKLQISKLLNASCIRSFSSPRQVSEVNNKNAERPDAMQNG